MARNPTTLLALLSRGARRHPHRCALTDEYGELSYAEFLDLVHDVIATLRSIEPMTPGGNRKYVANLSPGRWAVAACIAATALGVYVPLDVTHPLQRRRTVLDAVKPCLLLTDEGADLRSDHEVLLNRGLEPLAAGISTTARQEGTLGRLAAPVGVAVAYIIHTSGSTGVPKGVLLQHQGLSNVVAEQRRLLHLPSGARVLQASSMAFDASIFEIALALGCGGTLVVAPRSVGRLRAALRGVDCAVLTPSLIRQLDDSDTDELDLLISAGEALHWSDLANVSRRCRVVNAYGPTETTIWATLAELPSRLRHTGPPPIGRVIGGLEASIWSNGSPSLGGEAEGELLISGVGLAAGYYQRPVETAASFVTIGGRRWYRTGDLVRRDPDGVLHYLSRLDAQVKVAGHRVELGEVEAALRSAPGIRSAVAIAMSDRVTGRRLEAFVVRDSAAGSQNGSSVEDDRTVLLATVRRSVEAVLPAAVRPRRIHLLDAFPLTTSGKVDRIALEHLAESSSWVADAQQFQEARQDVEETPLGALVLTTVADVLALPLDKVTEDDDFTAIGGSSLAALEVADRLTGLLGRDVDVEVVVRSRSLRDLIRSVLAISDGVRLPRDDGGSPI